MKLKWYAVTATLTCCFLFGSSADTAVDVDINNAVDNNGMAVNFGGSPFLGSLVANHFRGLFERPRGGCGNHTIREARECIFW